MAVVMNDHHEGPAHGRVVMRFKLASVEQQSQENRIFSPEPAQKREARECDETDHNAAERQKQTQSNEQPAEENLAVTPA
jgi:hypothetical protein